MAATDIYDTLTPSGVPVDQFGIAKGDPGYDANSTANAAVVAQLNPVQANQVAMDQARAAAGLPPIEPKPTPIQNGFFFDTPSVWQQNQTPAQQRQALQLDELATTAATRKYALQRAQEQAPLEDALAQARIEAEGAHGRYQAQQDTQLLNHTTGFFNHLTAPGAPGPHDPGYDQYVLKGLLRNPRFAESAAGREELQKIGKSHDANMSIADLKSQLPAGFDVQRVEVGGGKTSHILATRTDGSFAKDLKSQYGLLPSQFNAPTSVSMVSPGADGKSFVPTVAGSHVNLQVLDTAGQPKTVIMPKADYLKFGGKLSAQDSAVPTSSNTPVQVQSVEQANALPSGTTFLTPQGVLKRKP